MPTKSSPWGLVQHSECREPGIEWVSTASHGGFWVDAAHRAQMQTPLARMGDAASSPTSGAWYEEDCAWAAVAVAFPHLFKQEEVARAWETLKNWYPEEYAELLGVPVEVPQHLQELRAWQKKNIVYPGSSARRTI